MINRETLAGLLPDPNKGYSSFESSVKALMNFEGGINQLTEPNEQVESRILEARQLIVIGALFLSKSGHWSVEHGTYEMGQSISDELFGPEPERALVDFYSDGKLSSTSLALNPKNIPQDIIDVFRKNEIAYVQHCRISKFALSIRWALRDHKPFSANEQIKTQFETLALAVLTPDQLNKLKGLWEAYSPYADFKKSMGEVWVNIFDNTTIPKNQLYKEILKEITTDIITGK
jgi:hypothetical protein